MNVDRALLERIRGFTDMGGSGQDAIRDVVTELLHKDETPAALSLPRFAAVEDTLTAGGRVIAYWGTDASPDDVARVGSIPSAEAWIAGAEWAVAMLRDQAIGAAEELAQQIVLDRLAEDPEAGIAGGEEAHRATS